MIAAPATTSPRLTVRAGRWLALLLPLLLAACCPPPLQKPVPPPRPSLKAVPWSSLPGWSTDQTTAAWGAFLTSCQALEKQPAWQTVCAGAMALGQPNSQAARTFFQSHFIPYQLINPDGGTRGTITGYYEPLLHGGRARSSRNRYPVYGVPGDLLTIDLASVYPQLKHMRLRGRLQGNRVVPYYSRADIAAGKAPLNHNVLFWVDNPIDLFFLQIQGSGRIRLNDGETVRVGYANQNGYPYRSIGRLLVKRGELSLAQASMQGIKTWARQHPTQLNALLNYNASYVFFRQLPNQDGGPIGALGVPLTAGRSLAIDPRVVPLGAPVYLATTWPNSQRPLRRLMLAQDTGGAINGAVRADFFWGFGASAAKQAGRMKSPGHMWVLLPNHMPPPGR